jgi:hypothetical protein
VSFITAPQIPLLLFAKRNFVSARQMRREMVAQR